MESKLETYTFKCTHNPGEHSCNGSHVFELDRNILPYLIYHKIFRGKSSVNKEMAESLFREFKTYVEEMHEVNQRGQTLSHFSTIDITAELLQSFNDTKYPSENLES